MPDDVIAPSELEKTAYHEAGHTVVAKLLGRLIKSIMLFHTKQAEIWAGIASNEPAAIIDLNWSILDLEQYIPYGELEFQYPSYPEPYEAYKIIRDNCVIKYAGWVTEALLYEQCGLDNSPKLSDESASDLQVARGLLQEKFPHAWEEELSYAERYARKILRNQLCWRMVENLAKVLINAILQGKQPLRQDNQNEVFKFSQELVYESFRLTLTEEPS